MGKLCLLEGVGPRTIAVLAQADDCPVCWICLDGPGPDRPLVHPCNCPSWCHSGCIARWQLQSAGTRRETHCDFCRQRLPDWKDVLTPQADTTSAPAVMNVNFDSKTYSFTVAPGPDGYKQFTQAIRKAFHLPDDSELNITFTCDEPSSGSLLTLSGPGAYDAAVHCAAVSAARRSSLSGASTDNGGHGEGGPATDPPLQPIVVGSQVGAEQSVPAAPATPGGAANGLRSPRRRLPALRATHGVSGSGSASTSSGSPRSDAGGARCMDVAAAGGAEGVAQRRAQSDVAGAGGGRDQRDQRREGGGGLGRKLRNALSDMLVIR